MERLYVKIVCVVSEKCVLQTTVLCTQERIQLTQESRCLLSSKSHLFIPPPPPLTTAHSNQHRITDSTIVGEGTTMGSHVVVR